MRIRVWSTSVFATVLAAGLTAGAQAQQPPAQQPSAQMKAPADGAVTIVACIAKETDVLKPRAPLPANPGMGDEFVLTQAKAKTSDTAVDPTNPEAGAPPAATGTSGSFNRFGTVYRATGEKEADLKNYVGQRVEITGAFKGSDTMRDPGATGTSGSGVMAEPTVENTREFTIASITPVPGSCAAVMK